MSTYLFAWNPALWGWPELGREIRRLALRGHVDIEWASGRIRAIEPGSRAFVVRLGVAPKGIMASGVTMTPPAPGRHWIEAKAAAGITALYLTLRLEALFDAPLVTFDDLAKPPFARFRWGIRSSGTRLPSSLAEALEALWEERLARALERRVSEGPSRRGRSGARSGRAD